MFGSMLGDLDDDFNYNTMSVMNNMMNMQMRSMDRMVNSMMGSPFGMLSSPFDSIMQPPQHNALMEHGGQQQQQLQQQQQQQLGLGGGGLFGFPGMPNLNRLMSADLSGNGGASYCSSSVMTMTTGPDGRPQVYQATSSTKAGPGGVRETRKTVQDSRSGIKKMAIGHHIGDRAHIIEKEQDLRSGQLEERQEYINLDEEEAEQFNREFTTRVGRGNVRVPGRLAIGGAAPQSGVIIETLDDDEDEAEHEVTRRRQLPALPAPPAAAATAAAHHHHNHSAGERKRETFVRSTTNTSNKYTRPYLPRNQLTGATPRRPLRSSAAAAAASSAAASTIAASPGYLTHRPSIQHPHPYNNTAQARRKNRNKRNNNNNNNNGSNNNTSEAKQN